VIHRIAFAVVVLLATGTTLCAAGDPVADTSRRILAAELAGSQAYDTLEYLCDDIGPRLSGSAGAAAAVEWSTRTLRSWGLTVRNEPVTVTHWVRGLEYGYLSSHMNQKIVLTALGGSVATPSAGLDADVIEVGSYEELAALGADKVRGRIVLFNNPFDMSLVRSGQAFEAYRKGVVFRGGGASRAAELGAVAVLVRSVASASLRTPHTGSLKYDEKQPAIPGAAVSTEDADLIHRLRAKGERVTMHLVLTPQTLAPALSSNVIAEIPGREKPDEVVVIGGHLDSWDLATGAIDDGAGAVMAMETLRLLHALKIVPRRTIRAVLFMNEENGGAGGKAYSSDHKLELGKHVAAIESDSGGAAPLGFHTTLSGPAMEDLHKRLEILRQIGAGFMDSRAEVGSDIASLTEAGVPGFGLQPDATHYFDLHHSPADTLDKIDPKELAEDTAAMAVLAYQLAEQPETLPRVVIQPQE
jgi:carboxypeptidase Q